MPLQSMTPQTVHRLNDEPSTASIGPYLAFFQILHVESSLTQSTDQQHGPSIHLRSIDASRCSILSFSSTSSTEAFSDLINDFSRRSIDQSTNHRSFCGPTLSHNLSSCFQMLEPPVDDHHLRSVDGTTGHQCLRGSLLH